MHLIAGSDPSVNKMCILFRKTKMIHLKPNQNLYRSGRRSVSVSDWPEITYFAKLISNIFRLVDRGHDPRHWNLERPSMPSLLAYNIRIYSKVEDYATENKTHVNTQIRVRENGGSLDFNFISLLNSAIDENWVC